MVWGPPAQQSRLPEAYPRKGLLFWGEGWGWPDDELQRSPTRLGPWRASGVGVRAFAPSILQLARFASGGARPWLPGRAWNGRLLAARAFASASSAPWAPVRASASGAYAPLSQ